MKLWCQCDVSFGTSDNLLLLPPSKIPFQLQKQSSATKFCLKKIYGCVFENITTPFQYFKSMHGPGFFSAWSKDFHSFENYLDNPHMHYNLKQAD